MFTAGRVAELAEAQHHPALELGDDQVMTRTLDPASSSRPRTAIAISANMMVISSSLSARSD
jgi:hypothetical protein